MTLQQAAKAPITLSNAKQMIDNEGSYIVRRSEKGSAVIGKRTSGKYYLMTRTSAGREGMTDFDELAEAIDTLNFYSANCL